MDEYMLNMFIELSKLKQMIAI